MSQWVVVLEVVPGPGQEPFSPTDLEWLLHDVVELEPVALHDVDRYAVQLRVDAPEPAAAASVALSTWRRVTSSRGMDHSSVVRTEVMTVEEFETDLQRSADLAGGGSWEVRGSEPVEDWAEDVLRAVRGDRFEAFCAALADDDPKDLYDHAPCGYLSTLPDGTIVKVNQTFLAWTGYGRHELVGRKRFVDLLSRGGRIFHETHYSPMLHLQGRVREIATEILCADSRPLPVLLNSVLRRDRSGNPVVIRTAVFDATERRGYEQELLRARQDAERTTARSRLLAQTLPANLTAPEGQAVAGAAVAGESRPGERGDEGGGDFSGVLPTPGADE